MLTPQGKYCMYLRKSRADQEAEQHGELETLARHEQLLTELAKRLGIQVQAVYKEIVSGETIAARPEMTRLLADVEAGAWNGVLVVEVERLARGDTIDQGIVAQAFKFSGTKIITPAKIYDPDNEFDEEYFEFGLFMSRREYKTISRRINRGRIASVKEGKYISPVAPYGYKRVKLRESKGYTLAPDPEQAPVVRLIYDLYVNGKNGEEMGSRKIALYLDSLGIKPMKKGSWSPATIRDMLKNEIYTGRSVWQKRREVKSVKNGTVTKSRPTAKEYISVPGLHEAIISEETFAAARKIMEQHVHTTSTAGMPLQNPLSGLVYCAKCGALMTRLGENARTRYSVLKCPNTHCDNISAPIFLIEKEILSFLREWLDNYKLTLQTGGNRRPDLTAGALQESLAAARKELEDLHARREKTYDLLESGIYSNEVFLERNGKLTGEIKTAEAALQKMETELAAQEQKNREFSDLLPRAYELIALYEKTNAAAEKNRILKQLIVKADYVKTTRNARGRLENCNFSLHVYPKLPD